MLYATAVFSFIAVAFVSSSAQDKPEALRAAPDKELEGTWIVREALLGGDSLPADATKNFRLKITGDRYSFTAGAGADEGVLKVHPDKKPKTMDITGIDGPNKGKTILAIYETDGDSLKICYDLEGKERPQEFKTDGKKQRFYVIYLREKK